MSTNDTARLTGNAPATTPAIVRVIVAAVVRGALALMEKAMDWQDRHKQRRALMTLDDHLLKDIGISRLDAESEALKPFWRS